MKVVIAKFEPVGGMHRQAGRRGLAADEAADEALPAQANEAAVSFHRKIEPHICPLSRVSCSHLPCVSYGAVLIP